MKKRKISKKLIFKKVQISNLGIILGGAEASHPTCTVTQNEECN